MRLLRGALLAALLLCAARADAAWHSVLQVATGSAPTHTAVPFANNDNVVFSGTAVSTSLTSLPAASIVMVAACGNPNTLTVTSITVGGSAATMQTATGAGSGGYNCRSAYLANVSGSPTITANFSGACGGCNVLAEGYTGLTSAAVLDAANAHYTLDGTVGTSLPAGSFTTTVAGDFVWTVIFQSQGITPTLPGGYTAYTIDNPWWSGYLSPQAAAGATNPTWTSGSGSTDNYVMGIGITP